MGFQTINGSQIKNAQIETKHIKGKIGEEALNINFADASKAQALLEEKKVIDGVTLITPIPVTELATNVAGVEIAIAPAETALDKGVVLSELVSVVEADNGQIILDANGEQIYGSLTYNEVSSDYTLSFVTSDGVTGTSMPRATSIKIQYFIREDLWNLSERFLRNERLAEGLIDVTQKANTAQIVADLFGDGYTLNRNGQFTDIFNGVGDLEGKAVKEALLTVYNEIKGARETIDGVEKDSIGDRINSMENTVAEINTHSHISMHKAVKVDNGDSEREVVFVIPDIKPTDSVVVYVNGIRQVKTLNYTLTVEEKVLTETNELKINFLADLTGTIVDPDVVEIEAVLQ